MKIKTAFLLLLLCLMAFNIAHALHVVYVGEIDLLVYCKEGEIQTIQHDGYIQVTCDIETNIYLPIIENQGQ